MNKMDKLLELRKNNREEILNYKYDKWVENWESVLLEAYEKAKIKKIDFEEFCWLIFENTSMENINKTDY
jgi:hypothetical protein